MKVKFLLAFIALFQLSHPSSVFGCLQSRKIPPEKLSNAENTLATSDSTIAKIAAVQTLLLSNNPSIKSYGIKLAKRSEDNAVRAAGLRCEFLRANALKVTVKKYDRSESFVETASEEEKKILESAREDIFPFYYKNPDLNCGSIHKRFDDKCDPETSAFVHNLSITIVRYRDYRATFSLDPAAILVGTLSIWHGKGYHTVPATLEFR